MRLNALFNWMIAAAVVVGMAVEPARAATWPQWRYDSTNTAHNFRETLLTPIPDLFWFSSNVAADFPAGAIRTFGPVVADVKRNVDIVADHVVFVARRDRVHAYRPDTQASGASGATDAVQGWPFNFTRVGETNAPDDTASGLIQAPPIYARVTGLNNGTPETRHVLYVLTGAGEVGGMDFLTVHCLALPLVNPQTGAPERLWSRKIRGRTNGPVKLAGVTFADIGDETLSIPLLFLTTQEGRLHAINARPFDSPATGQPGSPRRGEDRWVYTPPAPQGGGPRPTFSAGPAVGRAALTGFPANLQDTVRRKHREWVVVAVDSAGDVIAFDAHGKTAAINLDANGKPAVTDAPTGVRSADDGGELIRWRHRLDEASEGMAERVSIPPLIWDGATPRLDPAEENRSRQNDFGHDDAVLIGTESGRVYALDLLGNFYGKAPGGNNTAQVGDATGETFRRWRYPEADLPPQPSDETDAVPFRPRALVSPLAAWNGVLLTDDEGQFAANDTPEDDVVFFRWDEPAEAEPMIREAIGSVLIYPRLETEQPIDPSVTVQLGILRIPPGGALTVVPVPAANFHVVPEFRDVSNDDDQDRDGVPDNQPLHGRIVITKQTWIDANGDAQVLGLGDIVRVTYRPAGAAADRQEDLRFPGRRRPVAQATPGSPAGRELRTSVGLAWRTIHDAAPEIITPLETGLAVAPPMSVANNHIWLGSRYRGRFYMLQAESLVNVGGLISSDDQGVDLEATNDQPEIADPVGAPAIADGWLYVTYDQGLLGAFANDGGLTPGTGSGVDRTNFPFRRRFPLGNTLTKPDIVLIDGNGNPIVDEDQLLFDWGETITIRVNLNQGSDRFGLARNPVRATLRGPMGDLPPVTASPVRPANAANPAAREVVLELTIPNATSQNPMTPGTLLLKDTPMPQRGTEPHWEIRVEQIGTNWLGNEGTTGQALQPSDPAFVANGPWVPNTARPAWNGDTKSSPWISLNNPIGIRYAPLQGVDVNVAFVERFASAPAARRDERFNGDPYKTPGDAFVAPGGARFDDPTVLTVGADPRNGRQLLFADHGKTSPAMQLQLVDRSDLGVNGTLGPLRVKVTVPKLTKLGSGQLLATGQQGMPGSINQNANFPDDGPDGYYASIPGDRLKVVKVGDGSDATDASVPLRGAATQRDAQTNRPILGADGRALKTLQPDAFAVSVDVPRFQPDDVYATRARVPVQTPSGPAFTLQTAVNPLQPYSDFLGQTGQPSNAPPPEDARIRDDKSARVTVFVDANNNGRLDLQGNFREAYRTFAVQVVVRPEFKLEVRERTVDLGLVWHGFESPLYSQVFGQSSPLSPAMQAFYRNYWKPFTLVNTGNVNLPAIKPEVVMNRPGRVPPLELVTLDSDAVDSLRSLSLVRHPNDPGANLGSPTNIYLRTTLDDLLLPANGTYGAGQGAWLQKARAGASAPSTNVFAGDPSLPNVPSLQTFLTLHLPVGTPLGTYSGQVRFFNDQHVQMQIAPATNTAFPGFQYQITGTPRNGLLDRVGPTESPQEPFTEPTFALKLRVTENLAVGSVTDASVRGNLVGGMISRTAPAAGMNRLDLQDASLANFPDRNPLMLFFASNEAGLRSTPANPLRFDLFGATLTFNPQMGLFPFDPLPQNTDPWQPLGTGFLSGNPTRPGTIRNTRPFFLQDELTPPGNPRLGYLFWHQEASSQPGLTDAILMYRRITPTPGDPQVLSPGGLQQPAGTVSRRMAPKAIVAEPASGSMPNWLVLWHGGDAQKRNIFYAQSQQPDDPTKWSAEKVLATSSSLASVGDPSPAYSRNTKAMWLFYSGFSQRLGRTDVYLTKYDPKTLGDSSRFFGLLGLAPVTGDVLSPNASRTVFTAGAIDWVVNQNNPAQVYIDDVALIRPGDEGARSANGEVVFEVAQRGALPTDPPGINVGPILAALRDQGVRVILDPAGGIVRFNMDTRRMRALMTAAGMPAPTGQAPFPDPEVSADYTPGTLRATRGDAGASGPVGLLTTTMEPSWLGEILDLQAQVGSWSANQPRPEARTVRARGDRMWLFWRRSAGTVGGGPMLYFKTLRPAIKVRRGKLVNINIQVRARPDLVGATGSAQDIPYQDIDMAEGAIYFREEDEGLVGLYGRPVPVEVTYTDPVTTTQVTERHYINWREEIGETPVPLDVSVNEGSLSVFPVYERVMMLAAPNGQFAATDHVQKMWLFWSSTRGSGNDLFQATLSPRFKPDVQLLDPRFGITALRGKP